MPLIDSLKLRSSGRCELCSAADADSVRNVGPNDRQGQDHSVLTCALCATRLDSPQDAGPNAWRCLSDSMWSEHRPVQVLAYRTLKGLTDQAWAQDLATQIYFDDETQAWADAGLAASATDDSNDAATVDANGTPLSEGDTVTLIKDLEVKGGGFTAKRGTTVKGINLTDDPKYVEGRANGIRIVLVAAYLKKA